MNVSPLLVTLFVTFTWAAPHDHARQKRLVQSAPIPSIANVPQPPPGKTFYRGRATGDVHYVLKGGAVSMFVITDTGVVVIDAPPAIGQDILTAITEVTNLPVTHLIYTHSHSDHIGSASLFTTAEKVAHNKTAKELQQRQDEARPVPTTTFDGNTMTLTVGGKTFQLDYHGPIHTPGNIFVWMPNEKVLYAADALTPGQAPFTRGGVAEDVVAYLQAPDKMLAYPFDFIFSGHARLGYRFDVLNQKQYLRDVQRNAITALAELTPQYQTIAATVQDPNNGNLQYDVFNEAVNKRCAELTAAKWITRIGYVDVYTKSLCDTIGIAQRIDYGSNVIG